MTKLLYSREQILPLLPKQAVIGEVGVAYGDWSRQILETCRPSAFYAIDTFKADKMLLGRGVPAGWDHFKFYADRFRNEITCGKVVMRQGLSWDVLDSFDEGFFDALYIDAAHDYESVRKDVAASLKVIKHNGLLIFDDYYLCNYGENKMYGVVRAVNELLKQGGHEVLCYTEDYNVCMRIRK